jgi:hypothetical protein
MRFNFRSQIATAILACTLFAKAATAETFVWKNVKIGGGGGFVPNII